MARKAGSVVRHLSVEKQREIFFSVTVDGKTPKHVAKSFGVAQRDVAEVCREFVHTVLDTRKGEIAVADQRMWIASQLPVYNPSLLVTRKGLTIFDEMRKDDQIKAALWFKKLAVVSSGWEVVSPENKGTDHKPTLFMKKQFSNLIDPFENVIAGGILTALDFGFSISELIFDKISSGDFSNLIGLVNIKTKAPHWIKFQIDEFGNLAKDGVIQTTQRGDVPLPSGKFLIFAYQQEFGNPYGKSDLEAAYTKWWVKENAYRWLAMLLERFGVPPIFALYDPGAMDASQVSALRKTI